MPTLTIIDGPTRKEQLDDYKAGRMTLAITLHNGERVEIKILELNLGHKFQGLLKSISLTDNQTCHVDGQYDPYTQTGEIEVLGPQFTP